MSIANFLSDTVGVWRDRRSAESMVTERFPDVSDASPDARRLIRDRRYCKVLSNKSPFDESSCRYAWRALEYDMALVPGGDVNLSNDTAVATHQGLALEPATDDAIRVASLFLDRNCVTNADFARFVQAGGYSEPNFWPEEVLPSVLQFVDSTGHSGPKFWTDGAPPPNQLDHPVVGVCWYEANAFAVWAGKRLPTSEEWQRSGTWPRGNSGTGAEQRYPWGNAFDPSKANLWASGHHTTVSVREFGQGNTPNGVRQLVGNVWEWVDAQFQPHSSSEVTMHLDESMAEIRGGAFDTYFHSQATCQFRTGQPLLFRGSNVGFRCCVSGDVLPSPPTANSSGSEQ